MYKKEVLSLNNDNFPICQSLMRLHLVGIGDGAIYFLDNGYVEIIVLPLTTQWLEDKQEKNHAMLKIVLALSYAKFDDLKDFDSTKKMWDILNTIQRGDDNVLRVN